MLTKINIANTYTLLDREDSAIGLYREGYAGFKRLYGPSHTRTIDAVQNLVNALGKSGQVAEAKALLREQIPSMRKLGPDHRSTICLRLILAKCLDNNQNATQDDRNETLAILEDVEPRARRVFGSGHPLAKDARDTLEIVRRRRQHFAKFPGGLK